MGKKNKLRHARRELAVGRVSAVLAARADASSRPVVASTFGDFELADRQKIETFRAHALRQPEDWRCRLKSRSLERRFIDLVRFTFAAFPVPAHLERVWVSEPDLVLADGAPAGLAAAGDGPAHGRDELLHWYIVAAQGRSLFKVATRRYLSKLETHHFLTAPPGLPAKRALWYAIARAHGVDAGFARKIAQTRLADHAVASPFWREAARFFSRNPISIAEMDEMIDYLRGAREQDPGFALKGRTLTSLRRRMLEWHRELRVQQIVCGGHWEGRALSDVDYETGLEHRRAVWRFRQIKTGNDLFREGQRMHHCVASYKWRCQAGQISIWSLTCEYPLGHLNKGVTLEVRTDGAIVQCRGFANRLPHANEVTMVKRWAQEHGLRWEALER
ncbi:MAG: PcfJ domain-containing protein [Hyphomicrobiales bacterium]|nr:PcfJ domain-containing protein [Hyphomicrobiales bacterium]